MSSGLTMEALIETWNKLKKLKTIYYISSDSIPKEAIPKGKDTPEPSYFVVNMLNEKVVCLHPGYFERFKAEAEAKGYELVDFGEMQKKLAQEKAMAYRLDGLRIR